MFTGLELVTFDLGMFFAEMVFLFIGLLFLKMANLTKSNASRKTAKFFFYATCIPAFALLVNTVTTFVK